MLGLLYLHVDLDLLIKLILAFKDRYHRVVEQTAFKVSLAPRIFHKKLFVVANSFGAIYRRTLKQLVITEGSASEIRINLGLFDICSPPCILILYFRG